MSNYMNDDGIQMYCEIYQDTFEKTKGAYTARKKTAKKAANDAFPEFGAALSAMTQYSRFGKKLTNESKPVVEFGYKLSQALRALHLKNEYPRRNSKESVPKENGKFFESSASTLYQNWVDTHDFIASDILLAHFYGQNINPSAFGSTRYRLRQLGYDFEQVENGWNVIKRPSKTNVTLEQILDKMTKEELINYFVKKLSK